VANSIISATINLEQISANARSIIEATKVPLMAVVKANAYGHGLVPSAQAALSGGATWLGTALVEEAIKLRAGDITEPILAWLTPPTEDFARALECAIDLSVSSLDQLEAIMSASNQTGIKPRLHLKVDTGMTRGGALDEFPTLVSTLGELIDEEKIDLIGTWSHLACADDPNHSLNENQYTRFTSALEYLESQGMNPGIRHIANSGAIIHFPHLYFDMVRSGLLLYGYVPGGIATERLHVTPVMELSADVALVKQVTAGATVGYGATVRLNEDRFLGLIPLGYADGIPRRIDSPIWCTISGNRYPLIGRVSMDQIIVDLGRTTTVKAGDRAIFFGPGESATADDWAKAACSISYEILSRIGARVPRVAR
jgi:alanine racemase